MLAKTPDQGVLREFGHRGKRKRDENRSNAYGAGESDFVRRRLSRPHAWICRCHWSAEIPRGDLADVAGPRARAFWRSRVGRSDDWRGHGGGHTRAHSINGWRSNGGAGILRRSQKPL